MSNATLKNPTVQELEQELSAIPNKILAAVSAGDMKALRHLRIQQQDIPFQIQSLLIPQMQREIEDDEASIPKMNQEVAAAYDILQKAEIALQECQLELAAARGTRADLLERISDTKRGIAQKKNALTIAKNNLLNSTLGTRAAQPYIAR